MFTCRVINKPNVAVFFGAVGTDKHAKILEERASKDGVDVRYQRKPEYETG